MDTHSDKLAEQEKTAIENTSEGYKSTLKSRIISGKPDSKPDNKRRSGLGINNENAEPPVPTTQPSKAPRATRSAGA